MKELLKLAASLCEIPSISGDEKALGLFLSDWLLKKGFLVEKIPVSGDRFNIFAYLKPTPRFSTIFCTHIDTVAPFIAPRFDENTEILFGRGSCDAKGIAAAMIFALLLEKEQGSCDSALLFTVGEEEDSDGAKALGSLKDRAELLVVGEPTELKAASAQKGTLVFDIEVSGREAHSSMPHLGESAVHKLISYAEQLLQYPWPADEKIGETLINIGKINGGDMRNMLAKSAKAEAIMRLSVPSSKILEILNKFSGVKLNVRSVCDPFQYYVPAGFDTFVAGFGSDAPYLKSVASHTMLMGPGSLELAHKENEHVALKDLWQGVKSYQKIMKIMPKVR